MAAPSKTACLSAFSDKDNLPTNEDLQRTLGATASLWNDLIAHVGGNILLAQWNYSGAKFGWSLRLKEHKRIILYLIPQFGHFLVGIVLSDKAVSAARSANLEKAVLATIAKAPKYAEGTGFRLGVSIEGDLLAIKKLAAIKLATKG